MTFPERRVRAADPARDLAAQPDDRAEHDLALLLAALDQQALPPVPAAAHPPRRGPLLVTALVAAVVVVASIAALTLTHPRTHVAARPSPAGCAAAGTEALLCGTFRSTSGTGGLSFLTTHPYTLLFTREAGLTMVLQGDCDTIQQAVTITGNAFEVGNGGGTQVSCSADERHHHQVFEKDFFENDVTYTLRGDDLTFHFDQNDTTATFTRDERTPPIPTASTKPSR